MRLKHIFITAFKSLRVNKSRSVLTILGIVIGIASIIMIMSLGEGAQSLILGQVSGIGSKTIAIIPGRQPTGVSDVSQMFSDSLKQKDIDLLSKKENVPGAALVMPIIAGADVASNGANTYNVTIFGATDAIQSILNAYPDRGSFFSVDDIKESASVVVIGNKAKEKLFGHDEALGSKIRIAGKNLRIVGVLPANGPASVLNFDEAVILPYTTASQYIFGRKYFNRVVVQVYSEDQIQQTITDIETTLRNSHNITDPTKDDFFVETPADIIKSLSVITTALTALLSALAAISLVVGGIGIMNIMLVSVTERTKEIGLRKAIGATNKDILSQFLVEAVTLTSLGGIVGISLGVGFSALAAILIRTYGGIAWSFSFPVTGAIVGFLVSAFVGLIFGIYPAREAARKSPMEAMRFE